MVELWGLKLLGGGALNAMLGIIIVLGILKLGILLAENPFCENPTFMANSKIPKYEKFKN